MPGLKLHFKLRLHANNNGCLPRILPEPNEYRGRKVGGGGRRSEIMFIYEFVFFVGSNNLI